MEASFEDSSVRADKHKVRNASYTVDICWHRLRVVDMVPVHSELAGNLNCMRLWLSLPNCNAENFHSLSLVLLVYLLDVRNFPAARTTPWRPEIYKYLCSFSYIIRELYFLLERLRINASVIAIYMLHSEICKLHARLGIHLSISLLFP